MISLVRPSGFIPPGRTARRRLADRRRVLSSSVRSSSRSFRRNVRVLITREYCVGERTWRCTRRTHLSTPGTAA
jgi:hypothetical protein